jgi:ubiquinone/menaquinone biosynthesis C-methylase UbiE
MRLPIPYQDPIDQGPLVEDHGSFRNPRNGTFYPIREETPVFLPVGILEGPNVRYQKLYDRVAPAYDFGIRLYAWFKSGAEATRRKAYLELLEVPARGSLLEVSVGTGANWSYLNRDLDFYGLDLSAGMLARCRGHARRLKLRFQLCQGLAEHLPYPDAVFDCVLHVGGINFFSDPGAALREMVRVAKPGTRLVVVDETEELAKRNEDKFLAKAFFKNRPRTIEAPKNLLPAGVQEVTVREIWNRELYVMTFRKPIENTGR